jgi:hypothetical protein
MFHIVLFKAYEQLPEDIKVDVKIICSAIFLNVSLLLTTYLDVITNWVKLGASIVALLSGIVALVLGIINIKKSLKK